MKTTRKMLWVVVLLVFTVFVGCSGPEAVPEGVAAVSTPEAVPEVVAAVSTPEAPEVVAAVSTPEAEVAYVKPIIGAVDRILAAGVAEPVEPGVSRAKVEAQILKRLEEAIEAGDSQAAVDYAAAAYLVQIGDLVDPIVRVKRGLEPQLHLLPMLAQVFLGTALESEFDDAPQAVEAFMQGSATALALALEQSQPQD